MLLFVIGVWRSRALPRWPVWLVLGSLLCMAGAVAGVPMAGVMFAVLFYAGFGGYGALMLRTAAMDSRETVAVAGAQGADPSSLINKQNQLCTPSRLSAFVMYLGSVSKASPFTFVHRSSNQCLESLLQATSEGCRLAAISPRHRRAA